MRSIWKGLVFASAGLVAVPGATFADEVQEQLQQMQQRMNQLEDRLQSTTDQLQETEQRAEEQQALIERSGIATGTAGASGLSAFIDSITVGGHVSTSYNYNTNQPDGAQLRGANGLRAFDQDADSFALDQIRFDVARPTDDTNRAGFRFDMYYGRTARNLNALTAGKLGTGGSPPTGDDSQVHISQGYIEYREPYGNIKLMMGKFTTLLGAEVIDSPGNFNISRGLLFTNAIPFEHLGFLAGNSYENGITWALGVVNGWDAANGVDINSSKSLLGRLGYSQETWGIMVNGIYGAEQQRDRVGADPTLTTVAGDLSLSDANGAIPTITGFLGGPTTATIAQIGADAGLIGLGTTRIGDVRDQRSVLDVILNFNPTENLKTYVNADFGWEEFSGDVYSLAIDPATSALSVSRANNPNDFYWGVSAAGRYALTEKLGWALRAEYLRGKESGLCSGEAFGGVWGACPNAVAGDSTTAYGITTTLDYSLTDNLMARAEYRYDRIDVGGSQNDDFFRGNVSDVRTTGNSKQSTVAAELIYKF